jgi:TRAP-type C4-dicarboxylate transport system substrate-binding protein
MTGADPAIHKTIAGFGVNIVKLTPQERAAFQKATKPVYDKWAKQIGADLVKKAEASVAGRKKN